MAEAAALAEGVEVHHIGAECIQELLEAGDGGGSCSYLLETIAGGDWWQQLLMRHQLCVRGMVR